MFYFNFRDDFFKPITSNPKIKNESLTKTQMEYLFNYNTLDILKLPLVEEPKEGEKQILEDIKDFKRNRIYQKNSFFNTFRILL